MAELELSREDMANDRLPAICLVCGQPAEVRRPHTFGSLPQWVYLTIPSGPFFFVVAAVMMKRSRITVPLCERHQNHWKWPKQLGLALTIITIILFIAPYALFDKYTSQAFLVSFLLCVILWVVGLVIVQQSTIRATLISDNATRLVGVAQEFADAVHAIAQRRSLEEEARIPWARPAAP